MSDSAEEEPRSPDPPPPAGPQEGQGHRRAAAPGRLPSNKHITAQVIDDRAGHTLAAASTTEPALEGNGGNVDAATKVGELLASRAKDAGVTTVVFDRGGNLYHGRIAALADAARKGGLEF